MKLHELIAIYYPQYHDIQHYPASKCVCIRGTKDEWGVLGNFYHTPIVLKGVSFDCTERLFHLMKFLPSAQEGILDEYQAKRGMSIKMHMKTIYKNHPNWLRQDWGKMVVDAMKYCLVVKYEQCPEFRTQLEKTKGYFIVEDETARNARRHKNADSWGTNLAGNEYVGPNLLGRLLMELRDTGTLIYQLPDDAMSFIETIRETMQNESNPD